MENKLIIKTAKDVLKTELRGVQKISKILDNNFSSIINKLSSVKGRVIFTGIGKSGHIAKKISSTMSSTGTPSQFCHSTEMSHGDLGIISKNDIVIILSNSGNSIELKSVIDFCKKYNIKLINHINKNPTYLISNNRRLIK